MPQNKFAQARYRIIDSMLHKNEYVKTTSIIDQCIRRIGFRVSMRTIQLDIEAMRHDPLLGFNAPIRYCGRRKAYYYADPAYTLQPHGFTEQEVAFLEELLNICPTCSRACGYEILSGLVKKLKFPII